MTATQKAIKDLELAYIRLKNHATYPEGNCDMCIVGMLIIKELRRLRRKDERERQQNRE